MVSYGQQKCVVVEIDRQKKLLHIGSDLGYPDLKRDVACSVPLQNGKVDIRKSGEMTILTLSGLEEGLLLLLMV